MTTLNKIEAVLSVTQHAKGWTKADSNEPTPISASLQAADKLVAAIRAVEAMHVPGRVYEDEDSCGHAADHHDTIEAEGGEWVCLDTPIDEQVCTECRDSLGDPQPWPCPTITAIREALG